MKKMQIWLSPDLHEQITAAATAQDQTASAWIRAAARDQIDRQEREALSRERRRNRRPRQPRR